MVRIKSFRVLDTAFVVAVIAAFFSIIYVLLAFVSSLLYGYRGDSIYETLLCVIGIPLLYCVATFLITACFCLIYNLLAKWLGGIQIELEGTGTEVHS